MSRALLNQAFEIGLMTALLFSGVGFAMMRSGRRRAALRLHYVALLAVAGILVITVAEQRDARTWWVVVAWLVIVGITFAGLREVRRRLRAMKAPYRFVDRQQTLISGSPGSTRDDTDRAGGR